MKKINMKEINKKYLVAGALAAVLVVGTTVSAASAYVTSEDIGESKAKTIAFEHAGVTEAEATRVTCEKDIDDGGFEYDVEFWVDNVEYDYEISGTTGEILGYDWEVENVATTTTTSTEEVKDTTTPTTSTDYIGEAKAKEIALAHAGIAESDATFLKTEFDMDDGIAEYEVEWEIGTMEYEYTINATTGSIMEYDVEIDD